MLLITKPPNVNKISKLLSSPHFSAFYGLGIILLYAYNPLDFNNRKRLLLAFSKKSGKMSAVISKAQKFYRKALSYEGFMLIVLSGMLAIFQRQIAWSFLAGSLASFLPFCLFTYWVFFRKAPQTGNRMTVFYRAEGLKWLLTILLVILSFKLLPLTYLAFFVGYFLGLMGNILLPIWFKRSVN